MIYQIKLSLKCSFRIKHLVFTLYVHDLNCCYNIETNSIGNLKNHLPIEELRIPNYELLNIYNTFDRIPTSKKMEYVNDKTLLLDNEWNQRCE
uniref:Uncharacterized protein n=1 Tax=Lepeophtheirus salmonis TaxID=72036 RepID=A0A0K2V4W5_LEPSM